MTAKRGQESTGRDETVLVTGASSGIGRATALYLAARGYSVIGTSRSMARLAELQTEASKSGLSFTAVELDINSDEDVDKVLPRLMEEFGAIDVLVNNAGYGLWGPVEALTVAEVKDQFETNFFAAVRLINAVLPTMLSRCRGTIINISSVEGRLATPFSGAYAASKFALEGLSEAMRVELWPFGVRVAVVEPGLFRTDFQTNSVIAKGAESNDLACFPYMERYKTRRARFNWLAADPNKVAKVIHRIVRSRRPGFRYPIGPEARLGIAGARFLPERIFQAMLSRVTMR